MVDRVGQPTVGVQPAADAGIRVHTVAARCRADGIWCHSVGADPVRPLPASIPATSLTTADRSVWLSLSMISAASVSSGVAALQPRITARTRSRRFRWQHLGQLGRLMATHGSCLR